MAEFVIERKIPGIGGSSAQELQEISKKSCAVLEQLGSGVRWVHSYVTPDTMYCLYSAESEDLVHEHARRGGFPANSVAEVRAVIGPETAKD